MTRFSPWVIIAFCGRSGHPMMQAVRRRGFVTLGSALAGLAFAGLTTFPPTAEQAAATSVAPPIHAKSSRRLVIKNAMVIYGNAKPPYGPVDILGQGGVIDATGKYVMPGIVNTHMHWHEERQPGMAQPIQYERNLYLAAGVTTVREVGGA